MINRRHWVQLAGASALIATTTPPCNALAAAAKAKPKRIVLRSSWQVVNIGDISHTPGVLALLERYLPDTEVRLWASGDLTEEVAEMEHKRFPKLQIVKGAINAEGRATNPDLQETLDWCDFLLHGSGPSVVAQKDLAAFAEHFKKPYGIYGITYSGNNRQAAELMTAAQFVYFRDSASLAQAVEEQIACPIIEFAPDGGFACDIRNDAAADDWLAAHDLKAGEFACCLARARHTPYWLIRENTEIDPAREARNMEMFEHDMAPLRDAISRIVRETRLKVLICPEDRTQMAIDREWLYDKLPDDVRERVVLRESFWLTDEALSTYLRSVGVFGLEMHSPIISIGNGIPAIVGRFAEQTTKGFMWRDIGLGDWLFDFDKPEDIERYPAAVLKMLTDRELSQRKVAAAQAIVRERQQASMQSIVLPT